MKGKSSPRRISGCFILRAAVKTFKLNDCNRQSGESFFCPRWGPWRSSPDDDRAWPRRARCIYNTILRHHAPGFPRPPQAVFCLRLFNILPTHSLELPCQLLSPFLEALCIVSCIETIVSLSHRVQQIASRIRMPLSNRNHIAPAVADCDILTTPRP